MRSLSARELLELWERASAQPPGLAAVTVLSAATGETAQAVARLPIGERDARLMALHRELRGRSVEGVAECPSCREKVETAFDLDALLAELRRDDAPELTCSAGRDRATLRLPTTEDLIAVESLPSRDEMRDALLRRCIVAAWRGKRTLDPKDASPALLDAAEAAMERADPAADVRLALTCPACGQQWTVALDIVSFLWSEITALTQRLVQDIDVIARAYGWSEADILALTPARRELYVRQVVG